MLKEISTSYKNGLLSKKEASFKSFDVVKSLYDLSNDLCGRSISKIEITDKEVVLSINQSINQSIKLLVEKDGYYSIATKLLFSDVIEEEIDIYQIYKDYNITNKSVVFDVGANVGWYSVVTNKTFPSMQVYAFEPLPYTFNYLKRNFELNNLSTDKAFNFGLSDENKTVKFFFTPKSSESSSMANLQYVENENATEVECKVKKLDDFVEEHNITQLDFIKCDVEGSELFVYKGGLKSISKFRPIVLSEMLRKWAAKFNYHPNDIIAFFENLKYKCIALGRDGKKHEITQVDDTTLETNYLFVPEEKMI